MSPLEKIKNWSDKFYIKKLIKPYYLPVLLRIKNKYQNRVFNNNGLEALLLANQALTSADIFFWLDFGTLLGVVRDGELIGHDSDIDIGVFLNDRSKKIESALVSNGFKKRTQYEIENGQYGVEESYAYKGVSFDIFYYTKTKDGMYCHLFPMDQEKKQYIRELKINTNLFEKIEFKGQSFNIPSPAKNRLIDTYGENYEIPDKNWYTPDQALNSKVINKNFEIKK